MSYVKAEPEEIRSVREDSFDGKSMDSDHVVLMCYWYILNFNNLEWPILRSIKSSIQWIDHNILKKFVRMKGALDLLFDTIVGLFFVTGVRFRKVKVIVYFFNTIDTLRIYMKMNGKHLVSSAKGL